MSNPTEVTVRELYDYWARHQEGRVTERSKANLLRYAGYFAADFGARPAQEVNVKDVLDWFASNPSERHANRKKRKGPPRGWNSAETRRSIAITIGHIFKLAIKHGLIEKHRLAALLENFERGGSARRCVTDEEFRGMLVASTDNCFRTLLIFIREVGCRPGEACAATWEMVSWEAGFIALDRHKTWRKTRKPRLLVLTGEATRVLCLLEALPHKPTDHIFLNSVGRPWINATLSKRMMTVRRRAGIPADAYLHGLRHSRLTELASAGAPVKLVSEIAGHSSCEVTERFYLHLSGKTDRLREIIDQFGGQSSYAKYLAPDKPKQEAPPTADELRKAMDLH